MKLEVRKIGNSVGVILPKQLTDKLHAVEGDLLNVIESPEGVILTPYDPDFDNAMKAYAKFSKKYKNALRELAK
jgi:putative addiction module antidote